MNVPPITPRKPNAADRLSSLLSTEESPVPVTLATGTDGKDLLVVFVGQSAVSTQGKLFSRFEGIRVKTTPAITVGNSSSLRF